MGNTVGRGLKGRGDGCCKGKVRMERHWLVLVSAGKRREVKRQVQNGQREKERPEENADRLAIKGKKQMCSGVLFMATFLSFASFHSKLKKNNYSRAGYFMASHGIQPISNLRSFFSFKAAVSIWPKL